MLGGVLAALACGGNSARPDGTAVAQDTTAIRDTAGYRAMSRDTVSRDSTGTAVSDSTKAKSGATEIKPGESTMGDTLDARRDSTPQ